MLFYCWWDEGPGRNVEEVTANGVTIEEVEEVLADPSTQLTISTSPPHRHVAIGFTKSKRLLVIPYDIVDEDDGLLVYPVTAFEPKPEE